MKATRAFWALVAIAGFAELGYVVLNISAMPVYLRDEVGLGESTVTAVGSMFLLTESVFRAPMGMLSDRIGRHRLITLGPLITVFTALLTLVVHHPFWFLLLRALDGLGAAMLWPAAYAAIGDSVPPERRAWAMSFFNMTYMTAIALGPLVGGTLNDFTGTKQASFYLVAILFLISALVALRYYPTDGRTSTSREEDPRTEFTFRAFLSAVRLVPGHLLLGFTVFFGIGLVMLLVKLYAMDVFKVSETVFGLGLVFPALSIGLLSVPLGRLSDRIGRIPSIRWGLAGGALAVWIVVAPPTPILTLAVVGACLGAISFVLTFAAWMAELSEVYPERRGVVLGAAGTAQGVGSIMGALLGGYLYEHVTLTIGGFTIPSYKVPFLACAGMLTLGTVLSWFVLHPHQPENSCHSRKTT